MGDQHLLLEKPQTAELHVRPKKIKDGLVYHDAAVQTDLRLHSLCILQGGAEDFFFSGSFFLYPPPKVHTNFQNPPSNQPKN